jgi:hypothetical protein
VIVLSQASWTSEYSAESAQCTGSCWGRVALTIPELEQKARCEHDAGMDEWDLVLGDISEAEDISQFVRCQLFPWTLLTNIPTRARDALFDAVYPLLQAIGSYAGCYVTLVAGNSGGDDATEKGFFTA